MSIGLPFAVIRYTRVWSVDIGLYVPLVGAGKDDHLALTEVGAARGASDSGRLLASARSSAGHERNVDIWGHQSVRAAMATLTEERHGDYGR